VPVNIFYQMVKEVIAALKSAFGNRDYK